MLACSGDARLADRDEELGVDRDRKALPIDQLVLEKDDPASPKIAPPLMSHGMPVPPKTETLSQWTVTLRLAIAAV